MGVGVGSGVGSGLGGSGLGSFGLIPSFFLILARTLSFFFLNFSFTGIHRRGLVGKFMLSPGNEIVLTVFEPLHKCLGLRLGFTRGQVMEITDLEFEGRFALELRVLQNGAWRVADVPVRYRDNYRKI